MESNDISFSLEQRKYKVNEVMKGNKSVTFEKLEELEKLDNTNKENNDIGSHLHALRDGYSSSSAKRC